MNKHEKKYDEYINGVVAGHVHQLEGIKESLDSFNLKLTSKKELPIHMMLESGIYAHAASLAEAQRVADVIFDKELKFSDEIEDIIKAVKKIPVIFINDRVETANGVAVEELVTAVRSAANQE